MKFDPHTEKENTSYGDTSVKDWRYLVMLSSNNVTLMVFKERLGKLDWVDG